MKTLFAFASILILTSCASIAPGNDPLVVHAEQSVAVAWATVDTFVKLDNVNRDLWRVKFAAAHKFAEYLRAPVGNPPTQRGIAWIETAVKSKTAYKQFRTPANKTGLVKDLSTLDTLISETQKHLDNTQPDL